MDLDLLYKRNVPLGSVDEATMELDDEAISQGRTVVMDAPKVADVFCVTFCLFTNSSHGRLL